MNIHGRSGKLKFHWKKIVTLFTVTLLRAVTVLIARKLEQFEIVNQVLWT